MTRAAGAPGKRRRPNWEFLIYLRQLTYLRYIIDFAPDQSLKKAARPPTILPFQILVSPFVHYDPINRTTDILMFNSRNLGALIVKEDPHVVAWDDNRYAIQGSSVPPLWDGTFEVEASEWPITRASARGPLSATFQNHCRASPPDPSELPTIQCIRKKPGLTRSQDRAVP